MDDSFWYQYLNSFAIGQFDSYGTLMSLFCFVQLSNNTKFLGILFYFILFFFYLFAQRFIIIIL